MKFLNKVIVFVMGIVVLGIVSTLVFNMSHETDRVVVTFEILSENTLTPGTYNKLNEYIENTEGTINDIDFIFNDITYNGMYRNIISGNIELYFNDYEYIFIYDNDTWLQEDPQNIIITTGDKFIFKETTPPQLTGVTSTLIILTPLILSASLIGFLAFKKGDEQ